MFSSCRHYVDVAVGFGAVHIVQIKKNSLLATTNQCIIDNMEFNLRNSTINPNEWKRFDAGPLASYDERIYVTINHRDNIYMNRHTHKLLGSPNYAELYMNLSSGVILVAAVPEETQYSFPLKPKQVGYVILAARFFRHHGIKVKGTQQIVRPQIENGRMILDLDKTVSTDLGFRRPRGVVR